MFCHRPQIVLSYSQRTSWFFAIIFGDYARSISHMRGSNEREMLSVFTYGNYKKRGKCPMKKLFDVKGIPRDTLDICGMENAADRTRMSASGTDCCSCCAGGCG